VAQGVTGWLPALGCDTLTPPPHHLLHNQPSAQGESDPKPPDFRLQPPRVALSPKIRHEACFVSMLDKQWIGKHIIGVQ
jgi:hypothetical protein